MPRNVCDICGEEHQNQNLKRGLNNKMYCKSCIKREGLEKCIECGVYLRGDEIFLSGSGFMCKHHWEEHFGFCHECGGVYNNDYLHTTTDGHKICQSCFSDKYFVCPECHKVESIDKGVEITTRRGKVKICKKCRETKYVECNMCHKLEHVHEMIEITYYENGEKKEICGCKSCISEKFQRCNSCGRWFPKGQMTRHYDGSSSDSMICDACYYQNNIIRQYSFKPQPKFRHVDSEPTDLMFGVENEIELNRNRDGEHMEIRVANLENPITIGFRHYIASIIDQSIPDFFYQKNDGSLRYGIEIVSHPATLNYWHSQADKIEEMFSKLRDEKCQGEKATTAGMHVHISRKNMNRQHQNAFSAFVYTHKDNIEKLACRMSNGYSKFMSLPNTAENEEQERKFHHDIVEYRDRYNAVNWCNSHTVELRVFRSTLKTKQFMSNVEFCHSLYLFTKDRPVIECVDDTAWVKFCQFLASNESTYLYLPKTLQTKEIWTV